MVWSGRASLFPDLIDASGQPMALYGNSTLSGIGGVADPDDRASRYNQGRGAALARRCAQLAAGRRRRT
jgi:hypothetical protein